ncbi:MAG: hypothetical protein HQL89_13340 [Magnetococcales bacterium]|nr:hypothetical protein [Magnetococcales bacterium]
MSQSSLTNQLRQRVSWGSLRHHYWTLAGHLSRCNRLWHLEEREFRHLAIKDLWQFMRRHDPSVIGETRARASEALHWLFRGQEATPDDGVSMGYFPVSGLEAPWRPSYPETTGYIIVTLLEYGSLFQHTQAQRRARAMGHWEAAIQMPSGAVQGGTLAAPARQTPAVFNTGMVLQGWTALLERGWDETLARAATRAADFLVADQGADGHFRTHGDFVRQDRIKTYNVLCAWPLYRLGLLMDHAGYRDAAIRSARAAMAMQQDNGWFAHNDLTRPEAPLTHTLGYTLQGLLEVGQLAGDDAMIQAVARGLEPLLARVDHRGFLHGRFDDQWHPACFSSCLTGSAQIAIVSYRMHQITQTPHHRTLADRMVNFLKGLQQIATPHPGIRGALAGSHPMFPGSYMTAGYPNWATKYFLDALMLQERLTHPSGSTMKSQTCSCGRPSFADDHSTTACSPPDDAPPTPR